MCNFDDKQLASFVVIIVFISVFFVADVELCVVFSSDTGLNDVLVCRRQ